MTDFTVSNHGSICILTPHTEDAQEWVENHLPEDALTFAGGIVIEPRYIDDILDGISEDGLSYE